MRIFHVEGMHLIWTEDEEGKGHGSRNKVNCSKVNCCNGPQSHSTASNRNRNFSWTHSKVGGDVPSASSTDRLRVKPNKLSLNALYAGNAHDEFCPLTYFVVGLPVIYPHPVVGQESILDAEWTLHSLKLSCHHPLSFAMLKWGSPEPPCVHSNQDLTC